MCLSALGRYVLEEGHIPKGIPTNPAQRNAPPVRARPSILVGDAAQLKLTGLRTSLAAEIADFALVELRRINVDRDWETTLDLHEGVFRTEHQYYLDVGDYKQVRLATNANPTSGGRLEELPGGAIHAPRKSCGPRFPLVCVRVDLTKLARSLEETFNAP